jgi:RNA polymerase sigma-70 factor (ECF subfamily)
MVFHKLPVDAASLNGSNKPVAGRIIVLAGPTMAAAGHTDADLLRRFQAGDGGALDLLLDRYETPLFQFLVGMLRDHHQAEDALQETFLRALERLEGVDPAHLRGWLFTVAYHQAMLAKRRQKRRSASDKESPDRRDPSLDPGAEAEQRESAGRMRRLLDQLPQQQREVIRQRVYEGKRFREIAAALHCPLNTALARMHEGLKRLRLLWDQDHA